jgi:hypothetical protein
MWIVKKQKNNKKYEFWLLSQPLSHLSSNIIISATRLPRSCGQLYAINTSQRKQEINLYEYPLNWVLLPTKKHSRTLFFVSIPLKHGRHFDYWNQPLNMHMRICYLCCYLVTYRKSIMSITAVLFPFVSYLLTFPRVYNTNFLVVECSKLRE